MGEQGVNEQLCVAEAGQQSEADVAGDAHLAPPLCGDSADETGPIGARGSYSAGVAKGLTVALFTRSQRFLSLIAYPEAVPSRNW